MRQQSKLPVTVRGVVIGGAMPLICLPLVEGEKEKILLEADRLVALQPDLLEWRVDACELVENIEECLILLQEIRKKIGEIPLIFTCRIDLEGGLKKLSQGKRLELFTAAISSGNVDLVDIELCNEENFVTVIQECAKENNVKIILSFHNFKETPSEPFIYSKLTEAQTAGADIVKLAAMPETYGDVLTLLSATNKARNERVSVPIITMSMGQLGAVSRLAGGLFGSDITFAIGLQASAPGQIPIKELKTGMALLYNTEK
ncbi:MAG: type I 3-dehydroquinate dehydratase [Desulforhopalus sp.]